MNKEQYNKKQQDAMMDLYIEEGMYTSRVHGSSGIAGDIERHLEAERKGKKIKSKPALTDEQVKDIFSQLKEAVEEKDNG